METAAPQQERPLPPPQPAELPYAFEVAVAPHSGSSVIDVLEAEGWEAEEAAGQ
jgi:hypothetical protein